MLLFPLFPFHTIIVTFRCRDAVEQRIDDAISHDLVEVIAVERAKLLTEVERQRIETVGIVVEHFDEIIEKITAERVLLYQELSNQEERILADRFGCLQSARKRLG